MKQISLFGVDENGATLRDLDREKEIADLKAQLRECREESFRRLHRIADLEQQLQIRPSAREALPLDYEQPREKIRGSIQAIRAALGDLEKQFDALEGN